MHQFELSEILEIVRKRRLSGAVYMFSTRKMPFHIIHFHRGKITGTCEIFYAYFDKIKYAFRKTTFKDILRQRGIQAVADHIYGTFEVLHEESNKE